MPKTKLPKPNSENTISIPPSKKYPRHPVSTYVWEAIRRLSEKEVIYFSATGEATARVVDAAEVLKRKKSDLHVVFIGIGSEISEHEESTRYTTKMVIGISEKDYKLVFKFLK